jgi:hypothetical protein
MGDVTCTASLVRPLQGAMIRRAQADEAIAFGAPVYVSSYSGNIPLVSNADASADDALLIVYGVAVAGGRDGATSIADGDPCDIVVYGAVEGYSSMSSGAHIWLSDTTGRVSTTVGTKSCIVGVAETPTVLFVRPGKFTAST